MKGLDGRFPTFTHQIARDLRKAGIEAKASSCGKVLTFLNLGVEDVAALRLLHPVLQKFTLHTGLQPRLKRNRKCKTKLPQLK